MLLLLTILEQREKGQPLPRRYPEKKGPTRLFNNTEERRWLSSLFSPSPPLQREVCFFPECPQAGNSEKDQAVLPKLQEQDSGTQIL